MFSIYVPGHLCSVALGVQTSCTATNSHTRTLPQSWVSVCVITVTATPLPQSSPAPVMGVLAYVFSNTWLYVKSTSCQQSRYGSTHDLCVRVRVKIYSCLPFLVRYLTAWRVSVFSLCIILAPSTKSHILLCLVARWRNVIMGFSNNLSIELEELSCTSDSELQHFISLPVNQPCVGEDASNVWSLSDTLIICFCLIDSFTSPSTLQPRVECPLFISVGHLLEGNRAENAVLAEM